MNKEQKTLTIEVSIPVVLTMDADHFYANFPDNILAPAAGEAARDLIEQSLPEWNENGSWCTLSLGTGHHSLATKVTRPPARTYTPERQQEAWEYFRKVSEDERTVATAGEMTARWLRIFYPEV